MNPDLTTIGAQPQLPTTAYPFRYRAYASAHQRTPEAMEAYDRQQWPCASNTGFALWIGEQWREWKKHQPKERRDMVVLNGSWIITPADHASFDRRLVHLTGEPLV